MPSLDLNKITVGLSKTWSGFLRDWDRSLRSGNCPETTRYNYLLAAAQLGRYLGEHKALQQFFNEETTKVLGTCRGREFAQLRDEAIIRLYWNTGARLSEVGNLLLADVDMNTESLRFYGKGSKDRRVRFGPRIARAVSRYLRARAKRKSADLPGLWLAERGIRRLAPNGIKIMIKRRGLEAGLVKLHAHRWRHTFAHEWKRAGGDTGDLMLLLGWTSQEMPRRNGASAAAERAQETHQRIGVGDHV
jgi:site-specific recombinase XerD